MQESEGLFCQRATYKGKYGKAKEAIESARAGLLPQEGDVRKSRKERDQGRQEGGSSEGNVPCVPNQEFIVLVHEYWGSERPISIEVSAAALFFYKEAMCKESSGNGLLNAAKAVP
jgi:hypothetical protein